MGTASVGPHTAAGTWREGSRMACPIRARFSRAMYSGVVPQQPPNSLTPMGARSAIAAVNSSAVIS